jgi:hypothetical protein
MHENLKTTVSLRKEDNLREVNDNWQILIPDYYCNTFYVLYGRFRGEMNGTNFIPKFCDLYIQNYQGIITIGLVSLGDIDIAFDESINAPVYILKIHAKALHANEKLLNQPLKLIESPSLKDHNNYWQKEEFKNLVNNAIDCNFRMRVEIIFDSLDKEYFNKKDLSNSRLIDAREFKRDGDQLTNIGINIYNTENGKFEIPDHLEGNHISESNMIKKGILVDKRCNPKYVKLLT